VALPFVSVVLLRTLGYSLVVVTLLAALSQVANISGLQLWAPLTDRYGNKPVLGLSASVFLVGMLLWALVPKEPGTGVLVAAGVVHVLLGFAIAGLDVASNNVTLKLAPEDEAPAYLASASVVKAVAAGVAPLLGGLVVTLVGGREYRFQVAWSSPGGEGALTYFRLGPYDVLFLASAVLGLYAAHRLLGFREEGEAPPEAVARAMRRDTPQISSIAGMRTFAHVASYMVETAYRVEKAILPTGFRREERGDESDDDAT
jgi:MFS family permease